MNARFQLLLLLGLGVAVQGCNLKSETVRFAPELHVKQADIGQGKAIGLEVADVRADKKVGIVGDPNIKSITVSAEDASPSAVYAQTAEALTKLGFKVEPASDAAERSLRVEVRELQYESLKRPFTYDAKAEVLVGAIAKNGDARYERTYQTEETGTYGSPPGQSAISKTINSLLSTAIDDVLADKHLMGILAN
ncbi:MAG TPA: YajG family lipoprotein [Burkholderiales bacterium]|nr:YajG family lipoprotein [Burkholderiales bacterium]